MILTCSAISFAQMDYPNNFLVPSSRGQMQLIENLELDEVCLLVDVVGTLKEWKRDAIANGLVELRDCIEDFLHDG